MRRRISIKHSRARSACGAPCRCRSTFRRSHCWIRSARAALRRVCTSGRTAHASKRRSAGLAMGLGGVGVKLADLTMLYADLRGSADYSAGRARGRSCSRPPAERLPIRRAAWYTANLIIGTPPPGNAAHNRIAFKTGTSYGYRDAWERFRRQSHHRRLGWTARRRTVPGLIGREAAAPILFDAFARPGQSRRR